MYVKADMIAVVNCDRPRPLLRAFSHDVTVAILVFTNNVNRPFCDTAAILNSVV